MVFIVVMFEWSVVNFVVTFDCFCCGVVILICCDVLFDHLCCNVLLCCCDAVVVMFVCVLLQLFQIELPIGLASNLNLVLVPRHHINTVGNRAGTSLRCLYFSKQNSTSINGLY